MSPRVNALVHALMAGLFFFILQYWVMSETLGVSLVWAVAAAAGAAGLAYAQSRRGI